MTSHHSFDYIVIGGGTAGLTVAARLAENAATTVCVIEAGRDVTHEVDVKTPGLYRRTWSTSIDWAFMSKPNENANNRPIFMPRGKGLGGSSLLNLMQLGRAPAFEYDALEDLGNHGWNAAEFRKYFKKSISYSTAKTESLGVKPNPEDYGNAPIINTLPQMNADIYPNFVKAFEELGITFNATATSGENLGVWPSANAIHPETSTRISSASAYYEPIKHQANLKVITDGYATRIVFDTKAGVIATGVEYLANGDRHIVSAKKEVILSAGTIMTPHLLELSGIGDQSILNKHDIGVVVNLPSVGRNLRRCCDHHSTYFVCETDPQYESFDVMGAPDRAALERNLYETKREGMLATVPLSYAFLPFNHFVENVPAIRNVAQKLETSSTITPKVSNVLRKWVDSDGAAQMELILIPSFIPTPAAPSSTLGKSYFSFSLNVVHPFARGDVHIASKDPLTRPEINLSSLDNPFDLAILVEAIKFSRRLIRTPAFAATRAKELAPGVDAQTDADIAEYIRNCVFTSFHPLGTAAMLPEEQGGVVDCRLKVYGVKNLRVVDASIIPLQLGAHPQATIYAIAEKAADMIIADNS